jgi:uncharacterized repeat protein (TIGR01451 family)
MRPIAMGGLKVLAGSLLALAAVGALANGVSFARAATARAGWTIVSTAEPSNFSASHNAACEASPEPSFPNHEFCDSYRVVVRNVGGASSAHSVVISDVLPAGVSVESASAITEAEGGGEREEAGCFNALSVRCGSNGPIPPGGVVIVTINVVVDSGAPLSIENHATVEETGGEGGPSASTSEPSTMPNTVDAPQPTFGIASFAFGVDGPDGIFDEQAGDRPSGVSAALDLTSFTQARHGDIGEQSRHLPVQQMKDVVVNIPAGLVGNPQTVARCPLARLLENQQATGCPAASRVGTITLELEAFYRTSDVGNTPEISAIYNITPEAGHPAEFGFVFLGKPVLLYASVVPGSSGYGVRVAAPGIPEALVNGFSLTFFGDAAERDGIHLPSAFFTNPTACTAGPLKAKVEADSWEEPGRWLTAESTAYPEVNGCDLLQGAAAFDPSFDVSPETTQSDAPSGYEMDLRVPQAPNVISALATPEVKDVTVTLPEGVSVSPSAADGLLGCAETGPAGIDLPQGEGHAGEVREGEAPGADGLPHLVAGNCPKASTLGTVEIATPLLESPLEGHVYLAQPRCGAEGQAPCSEADAANGNLFGLYLEAEGSGVVLKLKGTVQADPHTGRLTATFKDNPQLPFSELKLHLKGGARAPLANPQACGPETTSTDLAPWSTPATADATPLSSFNVDWDGNGGACPAGVPFAPSFSAGTVTPLAGDFSPFTLTFSRHDREQGLSGLSVQLPPGLLGSLKSVERCPEPRASLGTCGAGSLIGRVTVGAGSGSHPFYVSGQVFLTGPYKGAPFGLSVFVPAIAGPFNLGNVVVRAAIQVDPRTAQITVVSDPLPQIVDGVPLRLQTVNVTVDRPGFTFNPTNCSQQQVTGTIAAAQGASSSVSSPFAVAGCAGLAFKPSFKVSTQARTSKKGGASLDVKVGSGPGQANIRGVAVTLPKQLPSRLTTIQQACPEATFAANPASCPAGSDIGTATAITPVLASPLVGPAYLVSHGGAAFPDLVLTLQGEGVTLDLLGSIDIKQGVTSSKFATVPDAPIGAFELKLPEGPHSALAAVVPATAKGSLCAQKLTMPTTLTGQNGALVKQSTKIAVTGCAKAKKRKHKVKRAQTKTTTKGNLKRG